MTIERWEKILEQFECSDDFGPTPIAEEDLDRYEQETGFKLPESYRSYLQVFGMCDLTSAANFRVLAPGEENPNLDIAEFNAGMKGKPGLGLGVTSPFDRAVFFATDIGTDAYFWDPQEVTDSENHEYKIYVLGRGAETPLYLTDSFWDLVTEIIMKTGSPLAEPDMSVRLIFRPHD